MTSRPVAPGFRGGVGVLRRFNMAGNSARWADKRSQFTRWCLSTRIKHAYRNAVVAATSRPDCLTP